MKLTLRQTQHGAVERLVMRILFAWVVLHHIPGSLAGASMGVPNGLARAVDLRFLFNPDVYSACLYALYAALVLYVLRIGWAVVLPYLALLSIALGSINNSRGAITHHLQIVSLVLLAQMAAHLYGVIRRRRSAAQETTAQREDRVIFWSQQAIVATYVASALTKLLSTNGMWFFQSPRIALQVVKTTEQRYYDSLDPAFAASGAAMAQWMAQHPLLVGVVASLGLLLELTTPLALRGR
ncbi:MAG TPA: hypothetical protein VF683_07825, partial [Chthoniobacterales bacterium]